MGGTRILAAGLALTLWTPMVFAGGQFVSDTGTQSFQRSGAFVAKADDPSALLFNPAGLARLKRTQLLVGANVVSMNLEFSRFGSYADDTPFPDVKNQGGPQPVPYLGFAMPLTPKLGIGIGFFTPHGYGGRDLPDNEDMAQGAPQRYDTVKSNSLVVLPSIGAGYEVSDGLRIGLRATWGFFKTNSKTYVQGLANEQEDPGTDTAIEVSTQDSFVPSFGVGIHYEASDTVQLGLVYNSASQIGAKGTVNTTLGPKLAGLLGGGGLMPIADELSQCERGGQPGAIKVCTDVTLPQNVAAGIRLVARDAAGKEMGDIEFDVRWENWKAASDYRVTIDSANPLNPNAPVTPNFIRHGLKDVFSARLGSSGRFLAGEQQMEVRAGVAYESAAAPNSWTRLDVDGNERFMATGGLGIEFSRFRIDAGIGLVHSPTRQVRDVPLMDTSVENRVQPDISVPLQGDPPLNPYNAGEYRTSYLIGSLGIVTWW